MDHTQVQTNLEKMQQMFESKMNEFQTELKQASRKNPGSIAALNTEFLSFKAFVCESLSFLRASVDALAKSVDSLEMRSCCKMLLVHGVPEQKEEDTTAQVVAKLSAKMSDAGLSITSIRTSYRMGKMNGKKSRPIIVKFADCTVRDRLWRDKSKLKSSGITLSEFLTKQRHAIFMAARDKHGINKCWTRDGIIFLKTSDGEKHKLESMAELLAIPAPVGKA